MALSEKLHALRKKSGLSQEQLAEQLGVSRQAVSKWETGKAVPESDTLIAISEYFHVTLDYLMKETDSAGPGTEPDTRKENDRPDAGTGREKRILGLVICVGGAVCLMIWGLVSILLPAASDRIGESSVITVDGNGIVLMICLAAVIAGAVLLLKSTSRK